MNVSLVPTGIANVASVARGLERLGATVERADSAAAVARARALVLPGVGAFAAGMDELKRLGLMDPIRAHVAAERPFLAVCLGFQLLSEGSEESEGAEGLGVFEGRFRRFDPDVRCPHLGWNQVEASGSTRFLTHGHCFFAHSFRLTEAPPGWCPAWSHHGDRFVAALERGPALVTQFHPELSGAVGQRLLSRWLKGAESC